MKTIFLTQGKEALVDDIDYEFLMRWLWRLHPKGYVVRGERRGGREFPYVNIRMHVVVAERMGLEFRGFQLDHFDQNKLNNQRSNLRRATPSQNGANRGATKGRKYKGVFSRKNGTFQAAIRVNGKQMTIGTFYSERMAAEAYNFVAKQKFGEFACLNDLTGDA